MRSLALLSLVCLALALPALAQTDDSIALQFYPEELRADELKFSDVNLPPIYKFVRADLTGAGNLLVVAYSNGRKGGLRVIDVSGAPTLLGENLTLTGTDPFVEVFDLDRDGRMEIIVSFQQMRTDRTSLFKWTSSGLDLWGPTRIDPYGVERSILPTIEYTDLDGDGILELIEAGDPEMGVPSGAVHRLAGGEYVPGKPAAYHADYVRATGQPEKVRSTFAAPPGSGRWVLRVINGDHNGAKAVSAGEIRLNGTLVVASDKLKQKVRTITVPVTLRATDNVLEVELRGNPGTGLTVAVVQE
jgi:hypothetical protein